MPRSESRSTRSRSKPSAPRRKFAGDAGETALQALTPLFPFQEVNVRLTLAGAFASGGVLVAELLAEHGVRRAEAPLGVNQFALLGVLGLRLLQTQAAGPRAPVGFLATGPLQRELMRWAPAVDPLRLPKHVFRARASLESVGRTLDLVEPHAWSHGVLERTALGYRLSVPPKNVEVYIDPGLRVSTGT